MELLPPFPDVEDLLLELLAPAGETRLSIPDAITPPLVIVRRIGGLDDWITDLPRVQVDCYGSTRRQTADMAEQCRQLVLASPATAVGAASIDQAWTESAPVYTPDDDPAVQRWVATYRIALRRSR